jgi:inosine-uridine nucleoside N-ribohydrolase
VQQHAVDLLADVANDYPGAVTLVAIAPLTNLALLAACYPGTLQKYKRLVVMGGSSKEGGNQNAAAEFNFWADPAAAQRVLDEDLDITLVGLDVTHQATLDQADVSHLRSADGRIGPLVAEMLDFYVGWHRKTYGSSALPMHDALAVASVIWPELLETADVNIRVDLSTTMTRGLSLVDLWGFDGGPTNAKWATAVRSADFRSVLLERLRGLSTAANTSIEGGPRS